ncbi:hypothetical protein JZ751_027338 [Albula glossodonta]|uniref:RING-type domain-containing protein n=1 Tax=Albula glossodonta TaxID=121402 RepID=A0A8T2NGE3_9TELE|nr:hypothetical protein JZ751_027338 [Albula glossodonta]
MAIQDTDYLRSSLQSCWRLKQLLQGYQHIIKQEVAVKRRQVYQPVPPPQYYSRLIGEMESLGWDKLLFIDTEFRTLKLKAEDSSGRQHVIAVKLKSKGSLMSIHGQFLAILESLQEFWAVLDEIDEKTWVLEPEKPPRGATMRRIAIGNNVSIKLEIDNRHPKMLPECCLLGAEHVVTPLRKKLNANMHLWNPECSVLQNLKDVLEIEFPSPTTHEKSNFSMECGICYSYRLDSAIPDQVCNDPRCGQPFHQACLYEWLRSLPSSRQSFNIVFGECPYCSKPVTVKMAPPKS